MYKEGLNFSELKGLKKLCGIYRLSVVEHSYIGSSKNLYSRLREHRHDLQKHQHTNSFLQKVCDKYGLEAISIDIIELCDVNKRIKREKYWISELKSDMNLKDPVTCELSEQSRKKLSESIKKGLAEGKYVKWSSNSTIDCYDYFGNYITTFSTKNEAALACNITVKEVTACLGAYKHGTKPNGISRGKAVNGYRFRYTKSNITPIKFPIHPRMIGSYFTFYYEDENGNRSVAFSSVKECWEFFSKHYMDKKITIIPVLKSRESWDLHQKMDNHNGSSSETERTIRD